MKIAVILNGQLRTALYCYPYLKEIFHSDYFPDVDYHIHTWSINDAKRLDPEFFDSKYGKIWDMNPKEQKIDESDFDKIKEIYKPKTFEIGDKDENRRALALTESEEPGIASWYSSWKAINNMLTFESEYVFRQNEYPTRIISRDKYDIIVRIRPDIILPKAEVNLFRNQIRRTFDNPKLFTTYYKVSQINNISKENKDFFPIIDYYQIGSRKNMVNLHKWVDERILNKDSKLNKYFWSIRDDFELNEVEPPYPIIIRHLMGDETYVNTLFNKWKLDYEDIHGIMAKWYVPTQRIQNNTELYDIDESVISEGLDSYEVSKEKILEQTYKAIKQI
mgnify:CR=1 FL=1